MDVSHNALINLMFIITDEVLIISECIVNNMSIKKTKEKILIFEINMD